MKGIKICDLPEGNCKNMLLEAQDRGMEAVSSLKLEDINFSAHDILIIGLCEMVSEIRNK